MVILSGIGPRLDSGNLARVLNAAKVLKHLDIGFDVVYTQISELAKLLGSLARPNLRYLCLRKMVGEE